MTVTRIEELSRARSKVYIDQEFAFVLYKGELREMRIKEGGELSEEDCRRILGEILPKRAKLRCMNLLKSREYTRAQLWDKLKQGAYPEAVADEALDYVASFGYIDDGRYAFDFIAYNSGSKSRRRIESDLLSRGIDRDTVRSAWKRWEADGNELDEKAQIEKWMEKRRFDPGLADRKERQKMFAFLMRKGFLPENIRKVIANMEDFDR